MANRNAKKCSSLLIVRELQINATIWYHFTQVGMIIMKISTNNKCCRGCGERTPSNIVGRNLNCCSHDGKKTKVIRKRKTNTI